MKHVFSPSLYSLRNCSITEEGFSCLASALRSNPSHMRELQLSRNKAGDSGVNHLSSLLEDPNCELEKLQWVSQDLSFDSFGELSCSSYIVNLRNWSEYQNIIIWQCVLYYNIWKSNCEWKLYFHTHHLPWKWRHSISHPQTRILSIHTNTVSVCFWFIATQTSTRTN